MGHVTPGALYTLFLVTELENCRYLETAGILEVKGKKVSKHLM